MTDTGVGQHEDPRVTRSRTAIVAAARGAFIASGFDDTSIEVVAAQAGVARRTVYNIYGDKETLFRAAIMSSIAIAEQFNTELAARIAEVHDAATELPALAVRLSSDIVLGAVLPLRLLVIREADRFPDLASEYFRRAPGAVIAALTAAMRDLGARGVIAGDDAEAAARHFAYLVLGPDLDRALFEPIDLDAVEVERRARQGAAAFLRAYARDPQRVGGQPSAMSTKRE